MLLFILVLGISMMFCGQLQAIVFHIEVNFVFLESWQLGFHHELVALISNIHFAGTQTRSRKKIIFKIVKCIQQIKMFLFKRCHGIHKNSSLSIVINHAICYLTSSRLLVGVSGCCFGRVTYKMPFLYSASSFSASMPVKSKLLW